MYLHLGIAAFIMFWPVTGFPMEPLTNKKPLIAEPKIVFHLEFIPNAELFKTANFLRAEALSALVVQEPKEMIVVEAESYNAAVEKLSHLVPKLPDIVKFVWMNGSAETILYEAHEANVLLKNEELLLGQKVSNGFDKAARMTIVLKEDKKSVIKYQSVVKKIENLGYKVTFAEGYMDAGWTEFPAIDVSLPNRISEFKDAILELSSLPEVNKFMYNRGRQPHANEYILTFSNSTNFDLDILRLLANGIEVYKVDKVLNRIFIHFPEVEERNKIKLEQIKMMENIVLIRNIHANQEEFATEEYARNVKRIWLDIPEVILKGQWKENEYTRRLNEIAQNEVLKLQSLGMVVLNAGIYQEANEVLIPEVVFTHSDQDRPKVQKILSEFDKHPFAVKPKKKRALARTCASLFVK